MTAKVFVVLPILAFSLTAKADIPVWFSADGGLAGPLKQDDYQGQIDAAGLNASLSGTDDWRWGLRLGVGLDLNQWLPVSDPWQVATQLEYYRLGRVDVGFSGTLSDADAFYNALETIHPETAENGIAWSLLGRWQGFSGALAPVSLGARTGITRWSQDYELTDDSGNAVGTDNLSGFATTAGLETTYDIHPKLKARLGWNVYWLDSESAQMVSAGFEFRPWSPADHSEPVDDDTMMQNATTQTDTDTVNTIPPMGITDIIRVPQGSTQKLDVPSNDLNYEEVPLSRPVDVQITVTDLSINNVEPLKIYFEFNKVELNDTYSSELTRFVLPYVQTPDIKFIIYGYTDSYGSERINMNVSQERADGVKHYLLNVLHINPDRVHTIAKGEQEPQASNLTREGRARNRRVEVYLEF